MRTGYLHSRPLYESRVREFAVQSFPESGIKVFSDIRNLGQGTDGQSVTLPIIENDLSIGLDNGNQVETVVLLMR